MDLNTENIDFHDFLILWTLGTLICGFESIKLIKKVRTIPNHFWTMLFLKNGIWGFENWESFACSAWGGLHLPLGWLHLPLGWFASSALGCLHLPLGAICIFRLGGLHLSLGRFASSTWLACIFRFRWFAFSAWVVCIFCLGKSHHT